MVTTITEDIKYTPIQENNNATKEQQKKKRAFILKSVMEKNLLCVTTPLAAWSLERENIAFEAPLILNAPLKLEW